MHCRYCMGTLRQRRYLQTLSFKDINKSTPVEVKGYFEMGLSAGKSSASIK